MSSFVLQHHDHLWYGIFEHLQQAGIKHGVSTRLHGSSPQPYATLNLGLHTGDDVKTVIRNRQDFCGCIGIDFAKLVTAQQVHGEQIMAVDEAYAGRGAQSYGDAIQNTDALITDCPNLPLMLFFADCVPILIADPVRKVIGIAHAGWKGTVLKIAQKTVLQLQHQFNSNPEDCLIGIGPSIGGCCFEVDQPVADQFQSAFPDANQIMTAKGNKWVINLWEANSRQLIEIGVLPKNIVTSGICTACNHELFFSYRREQGNTGRLCACISL